MSADTFGRVTRTGDTYKVQGADPKRKREGREEPEKDFSELLKESEKESEEFKQEAEPERKANPPARTVLDLLSQGTPPLKIEPLEEKKDE